MKKKKLKSLDAFMTILSRILAEVMHYFVLAVLPVVFWFTEPYTTMHQDSTFEDYPT